MPSESFTFYVQPWYRTFRNPLRLTCGEWGEVESTAMAVVRVFVRHPDGSIDDAADLDAARTAARDGDVIGQIHRGGHVEYDALVGTTFIPQPSGWRPRLPVYRS